jgi:hypothetical protein
MITAALLALVLQSVPTNIPGGEACRLIRTIAAEEERQHPDKNVVRDTHFRGKTVGLKSPTFCLAAIQTA